MSPTGLRLKPPRSRAPSPRTRAPARAPAAQVRMLARERPTEILMVCHPVVPGMEKVLLGRTPGAAHGEEAIAAAHRLARRLVRAEITRVHSSPRPRALETASIIARLAHVPLAVEFDLDDVDYGAWSGLSLSELEADRRWSRWNMLRSLTRAPGGETMEEVRGRVLRHISRVHRDHPGGRVVLISHAEVIRAAVLHCRDLSLDRFAEVEVEPASPIAVTVDREGPRLAEPGGIS